MEPRTRFISLEIMIRIFVDTQSSYIYTAEHLEWNRYLRYLVVTRVHRSYSFTTRTTPASDDDQHASRDRWSHTSIVAPPKLPLILRNSLKYECGLPDPKWRLDWDVSSRLFQTPWTPGKLIWNVGHARCRAVDIWKMKASKVYSRNVWSGEELLQTCKHSKNSALFSREPKSWWKIRMSHISHSKKAADEESDHDWHAVIAVHQRQVPFSKVFG